ncbi:MAG: ABC transporter permease [Nitrospirota bacterium]
MSIGRVVGISLKGLSKNKTRTFLMMLGVIIGIATLTVIVSMAKGSQHKVMKGIANFGPNAIVVHAGGGKMWGPPDEKATTLTLDDSAAIRESIKGIKYMAPYVMRSGQNIIYGDKNTTATVMGVTPDWEDAWQWHVKDGDFISEEDVSGMTKNCILGRTVLKDLFGEQNPIGETIRIGNVSFKIAGVLQGRGTSPMGTDMDNRVIVPLSTAMRRLFNIDYIDTIRLYVEHPSMIESVTKEVADLLRERHHITPPEEDDFRIRNSLAVAKMAKGVSKTLTTFLLLLSLVSLGVGGIVIANIMFISVNERKKEIGVRRAFGARAKDIMNQFLGEALIVTIMGGIAGTLLGVGISKGIAVIKKMPAMISWEPFALAIVFSTIVGIVAGLQPAKRAAAMDPVNAIKG